MLRERNSPVYPLAKRVTSKGERTIAMRVTPKRMVPASVRRRLT